jgi:hypothetical protein
MNDIIITKQMMSNIKILSDHGILEPIVELIEKLNLDTEDMAVLNKLINKHLDKGE